MNILILINDAPYGTEKAYNALRLAMTLKKEHPEVNLNIFLMADAVGCAVSGQNTPQGYYSIERMLKSVIGKGAAVKLCGTCVDARGLRDVKLIDGIEISTMSELSRLSVEVDKVITF